MKTNRLHPLVLSLATSLWCALAGSPAAAQIIDPPPRDVVSVVATQAQGAEPERIPPGSLRPIRFQPVVFTVFRRGPIDFDLQVRYTLGGTAENGVDYQKLTEGLTIPKGSASATIEVVPLDDDLLESPETVTVTLEPPVCAAIFPPPLDCYEVGQAKSAKGVILDNGATGGNQPPRITFLSPDAGQSFAAPASIPIRVAAVDPDGYVPWVEFFANDQKIGESRLVFVVAPKPGTVLEHSFLWSAVPEGSYTLTAVGHDNQGATTTSAGLPVTVTTGTDLPVVTVVATDPDAKEPKTPLPTEKIAIDRGQFTVTRSGSTAQSLEVFYRLDGTAINGIDYEPLSGRLTIPSGSASVIIDLLPINDQLLEPTETAVLTLVTSPFRIIPLDTAVVMPIRATYKIGDPASATIQIQDNGEGGLPEIPVINITASDPDATEPPTDDPAAKIKIDDGRFTLTRTGSTSNSLVVFLMIDGTATPGVDYQPIPGTVVFLPGSSSVEIPITPIFDKVKEGDETVVVRVLPPLIPIDPIDPILLRTSAIALPIQDYTVGSNDVAKVVIHDNDLVDPNTPPKANILRPLAESHWIAPADILIEVETADVDGYVPWVEFFNGKEKIGESRLEFLIAPKPGTRILHTFLWKGVAAGDAVLTAVAHDDGGATSETAPVTIHVGKQIELSVVNIVATDPKATEPRPPSPTEKFAPDLGLFTVTRTGPTNLPLIVFYSVSGSAINGVDYELLGGTVTLPAGADSAEIQVVPLFDTLTEPTESVILTLMPSLLLDPVATTDVFPPILSPLASYEIGSNRVAKVIIVDNPVVVDNRPPKADIVRPLPDSKWIAPADIEIIVETADIDGYVPWVEFFAGKEKIGDSRIDFIIAPKPGTLIKHSFLWKGVPEGDPVLTAVAHDDRGATTTTGPVTIHVGTEQPRTVVTVRATDPEGAEPNPVPPGMGLPIRLDSLAFTFTREGDLSLPISVFYHLEGTAKNGADFDRLSGHIVIPKGTNAVDLVVYPIDDDLVEGDETVVVVIDPPVCAAVAKPQPGCYVVGEPSSARGIIKDNDPNSSLRPTITLTAPDAIATEGPSKWTSPTATFVLHRRGPTNDAVTVGLEFSGTAIAGKDYEILPDTVTIPAGARSAKLVLKAIDDKEAEGIETVLVELLPAAQPKGGGWPDYQLGRPYRAAAVILDNDQVRPPCRKLGDGRFHLCLPAETGTTYDVQVSKDLLEWSSLGQVEGAEGAVHYVDPDSDTDDGRFYRIVPTVPDP